MVGGLRPCLFVAVALLAAGCAPRMRYRYAPAGPSGGLHGTIDLAPRATVGDLMSALRDALPGTADCALSFNPTASPTEARTTRFMLVSGELRLPAHAYCGDHFLGRVGVSSTIVISDEAGGTHFRWCEDGRITSVSRRGTVASLLPRQAAMEKHSIAWAAWSNDDVHEALVIMRRFQTGGVSMLLVDEGKRELRSADGLHGCEPGYDGI